MIEHVFRLLMTQALQITVLAFIVAVVVKLAAKNRPHLAHALWVLVLIKCVTPPLWGHSLGVFSQLQARLMPDESATLPAVGDPPASVSVSIAETPMPAPEINVPDSEHGQLQTYEPDEWLSLSGTEPPEDASLMWDGGTGIELDEAAQMLDKQLAHMAYAEPALPVESVVSDAGWLRPDWLLPFGLVAGSIMTLLIMVIRCLRCLRLIHRHRTTEFDDQLREQIQHLSRQLRIRRIPQIIVSDVLFGPAVLGLLRHTIVLPLCLFEKAAGDQSRSFLPERTFAVRRTAQEPTSAQRQSIVVDSTSSGRVAASREVPPGRRDLHYLDPILAHELLHIRRGDLRTGTLQAIAQSLWWFHPVVWLSNRWLSREAERCCDEQVIAELGCSPAQYARSLLSVIECKHQLQPIPVFPGMKPVEITTQRMERIMSLKNGLKKRTPLWCWLVILALAFVVLPGAVAKPSVDEVPPNEENGDTDPLEKDDVETELPEFDGNIFWSDTDLRKHLSKRERTEDIESATTLDADCESIKLKYCEVGYFDVEVKAQTSSADDPANHAVRFEVKEGSRYTIREVRFEGNNRIGASDLQQGSILKPGDKYSAFETSKDVERIRELYKSLSLEPATINPVPHFCEVSGLFDVVYEIDEGLKALIRLDESFIPSPDMVLTGDTVLAYVADKKITLAHVLIGALPQLEKDTRLTPDQRQQVLRHWVEQRLPAYLYDEVVLCEFQRTVPPEKQTAIRNSVEPLFTVFLKQIRKARQAKDAEDLERLLAADGSSAESLHESFVRRQLVEGYVKSFPAESPIRDAAAIESQCRQLLFEARLRQKVSLNADDAWLPSELISLEAKCGIRISRNAIYEVDRSVTVTAHLLDRPLLDVIKAIVEPNGFQVAVGHEEVVITANAKDHPVVETPAPVALRIPVLPIPAYVSNSTDPLVKLVWDAREASRRRLLMTDQRTPWQFMNGLLALRRDFLLRDGDEVVNGLEWVQSGPEIPGDPWFQKTEHGGQPDPDPAPLWFDDHGQAFLAALAMAEVPMDAKFATPDGPITIGDMLKHLQMTVSEKHVSPWALIALGKYLPPDAEWVNADGEDWSIEKLVKIEIEKPAATIHPIALIAVTSARDQYLRTKQPLHGVWLEAQDRIQEVIEGGPSQVTPEGGFLLKYYHPTRLSHVRIGSARALQSPFLSSSLDVSDVGYPYSSDNWRRIHETAMSGRTTEGRELLLFFLTALSDEQLHDDWVRKAVESAATDLLVDWGNSDIRSPFYQTTQALSIYLERIAVAGATTPVDQTKPFTVQVTGQVRIPGIWQAPIDKNLRVPDAIQLAGGATDDAAKTVYVIRNRRKAPEPMILQIGYNGSERGAEPNIFLAPGDVVLLQSPEIVKTPIANSIRLDDSFVLSPEMPISGSTVIVYVNDRPITVERFIGSLWNRLEKTPEITDTLKRRVALEAIASGLPEFVFQQLIEYYFRVDTSESLEWLENDSMPLREVTVKQFAEILEKVSKFDADPRTQARMLLALRARDSRLQFLLRQHRLYVRGMHGDSVGNNREIVIKYVRELLTTSALRNAVSLDFTNASLSDIVQVLERDQYINVEINSLHAQIGSRIFDKPSTVEFHCKNKVLGDAIKGIVEPFGMTTHLHGDSVLLQFADAQEAMEKFRSLPGPPSIGIFGIVKKSGWHPLDQETLLLDAIALAGGIADPEGVTVEITNPEIMSGNAVPVSMSLRVLQDDASGMLNRIVKDGDIISVTRNGLADSLPLKLSRAGVMNGKGVSSDAGLVGIVRFDQPSDVADRPGRSPATSEVHDNGAGSVAGRYDGPQTPKGIGREPKLESMDKLLVPERPMPPEIQQSSDPLLKLVWEARESSRRRLLTTDQHTPWQLLHGVLGLRQDFLLKHDGKIINGLEWIQSGPTFKDEPPFKEDQPWFQKTKHGGRAHPYLRPYLFEGHINQFAAILASCRLPLHAPFGTPDGPITMQDLITNAQMTVNEKEEVGWTLSLLSRYLPPDAKWVNAKGEEWSIERLVKVEVGKSLHGAPCGGTCGLFALAVARDEYQRSGKPLEGVWLEAEEKVRRYMQTARLQQDSNGTLSSNYFRGREYKQDFNQRLASSGALLQFLITAASDEQLREDWLRRAVESTANDLMANRKALVSCAPLFETTNAFGIYLDRVSVSAVAAVKPDSKEVSLAEPLFLCTYPVADLVVLQQSVMAAVSRSTDNGNLTSRAVVPAAAVTEASADSVDRAVSQPLPEAHDSTAMPLRYKADFAPLTELIKATVQPDSWDARRTIAVEEKLFSLVIRHTEAAHGEIADLLSQLRHAQDQNVRIQCLLVQLTEESQTQCVRERCSLHPGESDRQWALLPPQRSQALTQVLLELKPDVLSRPQVMTISGQTATIEIGSTVTGEKATTGIRLVMTPHLLPDTNIIRMQHAFSIGEFTNEMPGPIESLVGSGQTLLLLIDDPEDKEKPDAARSQYLLMMTPEHIPQIEEEEAVSGATPTDAARAVESTDSPDK